MSDNYVSNVLNLLRLIKKTNLTGQSTLAYLNQWAGADVSDSIVLRLCAYVQDQCDGALSLIAQSKLTEEAKTGLLQTVTSLKLGFTMAQFNGALSNHLPQIDSVISQFAILESVSGLHQEISRSSELEDLIEEVEQVKASFEDAEIDPLVASTAKKHLHVLLTLLRDVEALGLDAAMVAYAELIIRLRRVDAGASETARAKTAKLWPTINKWTERFSSIDKAINSGGNLLTQGVGAAQNLLSFLG